MACLLAITAVRRVARWNSKAGDGIKEQHMCARIHSTLTCWTEG